MTDINIMFWNIQNIYEYKTVTPGELELERSITGQPGLNVDNVVRRSQRLYEQLQIDHRNAVNRIMIVNNPDVVAIVEFSVGKTDLVAQGKLGPSVAGVSVVYADHFGPEQYMISLNESFAAAGLGRPWQLMKSAVNAPDLKIQEDDGGSIIKVTHKNSMFEFYSIFWRADKLQALNADKAVVGVGEAAPIYPVRDAEGDLQEYDEREPYYAVFAKATDATKYFSLVTNHSVYGGTSAAAMAKRASTVNKIATSGVVHDAVANNKPIAVCGDFNLDYGTRAEDYLPLNGVDPHGKAFTTCIGDVKSTRVYKSIDDLKNAYDQIFTKNFSNDLKGATVFNFAEYLHIDRDTGLPIYDLARRVSDHLPAIVTVTLPE